MLFTVEIGAQNKYYENITHGQPYFCPVVNSLHYLLFFVVLFCVFKILTMSMYWLMIKRINCMCLWVCVCVLQITYLYLHTYVFYLVSTHTCILFIVILSICRKRRTHTHTCIVFADLRTISMAVFLLKYKIGIYFFMTVFK